MIEINDKNFDYKCLLDSHLKNFILKERFEIDNKFNYYNYNCF